MDKIGIIIFLVVLAGIALYLYQSGLIGQAFNGLTSITQLVPHASTSTTSSSSSSGSSSSLSNQNPAPTSTINPADIPPGFTAAQLSPFFHEVRFGGGSNGQFSLNANVNASETIDVTGWEIKTNH